MGSMVSASVRADVGRGGARLQGERALSDLESEEWRPIIGFEQTHLVSSLGRVKRVAKTVKTSDGKSWRLQEKIVTPRVSNWGYVRVALVDGRKIFYRSVHRLVAMAFVDGDSTLTVNHIDGNKQNNRYDNLEWVSLSENVRHAFRTGLKSVKSGQESHAAKLTAEMVDSIKKEYCPGKVGYITLGKKYGVTSSNIRQIIKGRTWVSDCANG